MAEAVAAIGLVASGIQLLDFGERLLKRLEEFKSNVKEIPEAFRAIQVRLPVVLNSLHHLQTSHEHAVVRYDAVDPLDALVEACLEEVKYLQEILEIALPQAGASTWERRHLALKSLGKEKIIEKRLRRLEGHLVSLSVHQMNVTLQTLQSKVFSLTKDFPDGEEFLTPLPVSVSEKAQNATERELANLSLVTIPPQRSQGFREELWPARVLSKPSLFDEIAMSSAAIKNQMVAEDLQIQSRHTPEKTLSRRRPCRCRQRPIQDMSRNMFCGFEVFDHVENDHEVRCRFHRAADSTRALGIKISYISYQLEKMAHAAFSLKIGAGGLSIHPSLTFRGFVRESSPAFDAVRELRSFADAPENQVIAKLGELTPRLRILYETRKASPNEVLENGFNVAMEMVCFCGPNNRSAKMINAELTLLKNMVELNISLNEERSGYGTVLNHLVTCLTPTKLSAIDDAYFEDLLDRGAHFGRHENLSRFAYASLGNVNIMESLPEFADDRNCNDLSLAILSRSKSKVEHLLLTKTRQIHESNDLGQYPLHLAAAWPWALKRLLDSGGNCDVIDKEGYLPIFYALEYPNLESLNTLLAAGSPLDVGRERCLPGGCDSSLDYASSFGSTENFKCLVDFLVRRRQELVKLSRRALPGQVYSEILGGIYGHPEGQQIQQLVTELDKVGHSVDIRAYSGNRASVYHTNALNAERAEYLFSSGFQDIHIINKNGLSPVAFQVHYAFLWYEPTFTPWLVSKGARLDELISRSRWSESDWFRMSALHFAVIALGVHIANELSPGNRRSMCEAEKIVLVMLIRQSYGNGDSCYCFCSRRRCSPFVTLINITITRFSGYYHDVPSEWSGAVWKSFSKLLLCIGDDLEADEKLKQDLLRMILFSELGLQHTCCCIYLERFRYSVLPDPQELDEIRSEDEETAALLDTLCDKANSEWESTDEDICDFVRRFMSENMNKKQTIDEDYLREVRAIGVVIDEGNERGTSSRDHETSPQHVIEEIATDDEDGGEEWAEAELFLGDGET